VNGNDTPTDLAQTFVFYGKTTDPTLATLAFADATLGIRGLTVTNQTSGTTVYVYINRQVSSTPDFVVSALQNISLPIAGQQFVTLQFVNGNGSVGQIYAHITTDIVASSAGVVTLAQGATGYSANGFTTFSNGIIFQWGTVIVTGHDGIATFNYPTAFGTALYVAVPVVNTNNINEVVTARVTMSSLISLNIQLAGGYPSHVYTVDLLLVGI
jgi:hypothetical protein